MATEIVFTKNPLWGQPGEPEMLSETIVTGDPPKVPRVLSKTNFNKHGWSKLGMATFQKVLEDVRKSTGTTDADYEARAAVEQYDSAVSFEKSEVEAIGVKIKNAGHMTQQQYDAIVGENWPQS